MFWLVSVAEVTSLCLTWPPTRRQVFCVDAQITTVSYRPQCKKTSLRGFANNKGAGRPVHTHSLISTSPLLFPYWKVSYLDLFWVKFQFSRLVSVAEETSLSLTLSKTPKTDFVCCIQTDIWALLWEKLIFKQPNNKGANLVDLDFTSVQGFFLFGKRDKM